MEKKAYIRPNTAIMPVETGQSLLAASLYSDGDDVDWGGNASDYGIEDADAQDNDMSIWDY